MQPLLSRDLAFSNPVTIRSSRLVTIKSCKQVFCCEQCSSACLQSAIRHEVPSTSCQVSRYNLVWSKKRCPRVKRSQSFVVSEDAIKTTFAFRPGQNRVPAQVQSFKPGVNHRQMESVGPEYT